MDVCVIQAVRSSIRSITQAHRTPGIRRQLRLCSTNTQCARQTGQGKDPLPAAVQKQISFLACNGRVSSPFSNRLNKLLRQTLNYTVLQSRMVRHATSSASRTTKATSYEGVKERTEISMETYHQHADHYLNDVQQVMEELQEEREDVDVEYSAGVLTIIFPPNGTYVINKQPPNKQIWLSSPVSGPKRYDYVCLDENKETGDWVYLRDGSTMSGLLREELGVGIGDGVP